MSDSSAVEAGPSGWLKNPQDVAAGLFLIVLGLGAVYFSSRLALGRGAQLGPGSFPRGLGLMVAAIGILIAGIGFTTPGPQLEKWNLRGILFVLGSVVVFALLIRPLGLAVAGPLSLILAGFASEETRFVENAIFAVAMTVFCALLFKAALQLPIPLAPFLNM